MPLGVLGGRAVKIVPKGKPPPPPAGGGAEEGEEGGGGGEEDEGGAAPAFAAFLAAAAFFASSRAVTAAIASLLMARLERDSYFCFTSVARLAIERRRARRFAAFLSFSSAFFAFMDST